MATKEWAVTTNGTFDFNAPGNWLFGTAPGPVDIAQFDQNVTDVVTGSATVAELSITEGIIELTGSYTISGAQPTELSISGGSILWIEPGAAISGPGNISANNSILEISGSLSGSSATFTNEELDLFDPGRFLTSE